MDLNIFIAFNPELLFLSRLNFFLFLSKLNFLMLGSKFLFFFFNVTLTVSDILIVTKFDVDMLTAIKLNKSVTVFKPFQWSGLGHAFIQPTIHNSQFLLNILYCIIFYLSCIPKILVLKDTGYDNCSCFIPH